jgi:hypothetical protein
MGTNGASTMRVVVAVAAVLLVIGMLMTGMQIMAGVIVVFFLLLGAGSLMYRKMGPPPR